MWLNSKKQRKSISYCAQYGRALVYLVLSCIPIGLGCSSYTLETAEVRGTVTLDGRPLEGGGVLFVPAQGRGATGTIQRDGTYVLGTYSAGDGATVGRHIVTVNPRYAREGSDLPANARMVSHPMGGIEVNVESGKVNLIDIPLKSDP